jgi:hypothetical protein
LFETLDRTFEGLGGPSIFQQFLAITSEINGHRMRVEAAVLVA